MPGNLRVSQAERDAVAEQLRQHTTDGRLSLEEFSERLDTCLKAKTYDDLRHVLADLPPLRTPAATGPASPPARYRQGSFPPHLPILLLALVAAITAAIVTGQAFPFVFLAVWCAVVARRAWRRGWDSTPPLPGYSSRRPVPGPSSGYRQEPTDRYRREPHQRHLDRQS